jgi:hypothetical protein
MRFAHPPSFYVIQDAFGLLGPSLMEFQYSSRLLHLWSATNFVDARFRSPGLEPASYCALAFPSRGNAKRRSFSHAAAGSEIFLIPAALLFLRQCSILG